MKNNRTYYSTFSLPVELVDELVSNDIELQLPLRKPLTNRTNSMTGWASHYGGLDILYRYCGGLPGLMPAFNAFWMHGFIPPWLYKKYPKTLLCWTDYELNKLILVPSKDEQASLVDIGYSNVEVVGLPICYCISTSSLTNKRSKKLLFMPIHTLDGAPFEHSHQIKNYVNYILGFAKTGLDVSVCLHMSCIRNHQWWPELLGNGVRLIAGADPHDSNSLIRIWNTLSQFEYVSTNDMGSHVVYALAADCKVSICGPNVEYTFDQMYKDVSFKRAIENGYNYQDRDVLHEENTFLRQFQCSPTEAKSDQKLGLQIIGFTNKLKPRDVRILLRWTYFDQFKKITTITKQNILSVFSWLRFNAGIRTRAKAILYYFSKNRLS
jgi:hypothetical protein